MSHYEKMLLGKMSIEKKTKKDVESKRQLSIFADDELQEIERAAAILDSGRSVKGSKRR